MKTQVEIPKSINNRLMTLQLHLKYQILSLKCLRSTMCYRDKGKFQFYDNLRNIYKGMLSSDEIIILGDFNF